jgi:GFO/IDH/MocA oxidoreductase family protein
MRKLRTVVFGTGFMARVHKEAIRRLGNVDVAGVSGSSMRRHSNSRVSIVLSAPNLTSDGFWIFPELMWYIFALRILYILKWPKFAIEAGRHVICEKPLASTKSEARELVTRVDRSPIAGLHAIQCALIRSGSEYAPYV